MPKIHTQFDQFFFGFFLLILQKNSFSLTPEMFDFFFFLLFLTIHHFSLSLLLCKESFFIIDENTRYDDPDLQDNSSRAK